MKCGATGGHTVFPAVTLPFALPAPTVAHSTTLPLHPQSLHRDPPSVSMMDGFAPWSAGGWDCHLLLPLAK